MARRQKLRSNFQTAIRDVIIIGQCFGLNPVLGVCEEDATKLRFTFKSWRCVFTIVSIILQSGIVGFYITKLFKTGLTNIHTGTEAIFYCINLLLTVLFLNIAMKWPALCMEIAKMEAVDPTLDSKLWIKLNISCCAVMIAGFLEHLMSELHSLSLSIACGTDSPVYETYIRECFPWIFSVMPYNNFLGVLAHLLNIQLTFNWSYADAFIICMSIYLTSRLKQINQKVLTAKDKCFPRSVWHGIRREYNRTTKLVRKVDNIIGVIIFISFANNMLFICAQLLHTLAGGIRVTAKCRDDSTPDKRYDLFGYGHLIYYVYSFVFLVTKALAVCLTASEVYLASLQPAYALYDVPSETYCVEIERFLDKIHGNTVTLTGLQCFNVKRGLILSILGTIITYELVLLQFTGIGREPSS